MILTVTMTRKTRLLSALRRELRISDGLVRRLKPLDAFRVNGEPAHTNRVLEPGDQVRVTIEERTPDFPAEDGPLSILYEDECMIVLDKPAGVIVHPTFHRQTGTLANRLLGYYRRTGQACAVHVLTRLDRDTMGVVVFAKNAWAHWLLMEELDAGRVEKVYEALTAGGPAEDEGLIDLPIGRCPAPSLLRCVSPEGKPARTRFRVLARGPERLPDGTPICRLELRPLTGRTHQLRVHCSYLGFPILGDPQYQGTGNGEQGTGNGERGTGNGDRGPGNGDRGTGNGPACSGEHCSPPLPRTDEAPGNRHQASGDEGCGFLAALGMTPPAGTGIACPPSPAPAGQQLVARRVSLDNPLTGERLTFVSRAELRSKI